MDFKKIAKYKTGFYGDNAKGQILYVPELNEWFASGKIEQVGNKVVISGQSPIFDVGHFDNAEIPTRLKAAFAATGIAQNDFEISVDRTNNKIEYNFNSTTDAGAALAFLQDLQNYVQTKPKIALVVTGSVAAEKAVRITEELKKAGYKVACQATPSAKDFFAKHIPEQGDISGAKITLVAPATANYISLLANGLVKHEGELVIVPAMNVMMWQHPANQANVRILKERGVKFIGPVCGRQKCGDEGYGRMAEPADITAALKDPNHPLYKTELVNAKIPQLSKSPKKILLVSHTNQVDEAYATHLRAQGYEVQTVTANFKETANMEHIRYPENADLVIHHPCEQATLDVMARGGGNSFPSAIYLASKAPTIIISDAPQPKLAAHGAVVTPDVKGKNILVIGGTPIESV